MSEQDGGGTGHYTFDTEQATGTLIRVDHGSRKTWHHSVAFDGFEHETACGQAVECDEFGALLMDITDWSNIDSRYCCDECAGSVRSLCPGTEQEVSDAE